LATPRRPTSPVPMANLRWRIRPSPVACASIGTL